MELTFSTITRRFIPVSEHEFPYMGKFYHPSGLTSESPFRGSPSESVDEIYHEPATKTKL